MGNDHILAVLISVRDNQRLICLHGNSLYVSTVNVRGAAVRRCQLHSKSMKDILSSLPEELQANIIEYLYTDFEASLCLSVTSRHFRSRVDIHKADRESRMMYLRKLQFMPDHIFIDFACFGCLQLKRQHHFHVREVRRQKYLGHAKELSRRCLTCASAAGPDSTA